MGWCVCVTSTLPRIQAPRSQGLYSLLSAVSWPRAYPPVCQLQGPRWNSNPGLALFKALVPMEEAGGVDSRGF